VSVFDAPAHTCVEQLSKNDEVRVDGELRFRIWRDRAGRWHRDFSITGAVEPLEGLPGRCAESPERPEPGPVGAALARDSAEACDRSRPSPGSRPVSEQQVALAESRVGRYGDPYGR
jgi:single-stranded DNA-binding protein